MSLLVIPQTLLVSCTTVHLLVALRILLAQSILDLTLSSLWDSPRTGL